jgi:hypothetical protein
MVLNTFKKCYFCGISQDTMFSNCRLKDKYLSKINVCFDCTQDEEIEERFLYPTPFTTFIDDIEKVYKCHTVQQNLLHVMCKFNKTGVKEEYILTFKEMHMVYIEDFISEAEKELEKSWIFQIEKAKNKDKIMVKFILSGLRLKNE